MDSVSLRPIAYARNGFREKFGVPRQSGMCPSVETRLEFAPEYTADAFRGMDAYSHLWVIWDFSEARKETEKKGGALPLTVRPPRQGGNKRFGVFATRSPFRPNFLGLTLVEIVRIEEKDGQMALVVTGADFTDGTPIYDIKPYLPYVESVANASNGLAEQAKDYCLQVEGLEIVPDQLRKAVKEIVERDPRPAYQDDPNRIYGITYAGTNVRFRVANGVATIIEINNKL